MSQRSTGCAKCYVVVCVITYSVSSFWSVFSMLDLFLSICLYLHPGLAPLLLSADFFKSSTRPLQPAQSGRLCRDQRSVAIMHGQSCFLFFFFVHAHSLMHTHSLFSTASLSLSAVPLPAVDGWCPRHPSSSTSFSSSPLRYQGLWSPAQSDRED